MTIWEKVSNIIKTNFKSKLRYLKAEKRFNKKRKLSMLLCTCNIV